MNELKAGNLMIEALQHISFICNMPQLGDADGLERQLARINSIAKTVIKQRNELILGRHK